jgi:type VI secretion system protein ImpA
MSSARVIDFDTLLGAIPGGNPSGDSLRYSGVYDAIQNARRAEEIPNPGEWKHELKVADWQAVADLATEALASKAKDLQIAAWLTEAKVKQAGFSGLRDGLELLREMNGRFWDSIHPLPDDGDLELRAGPFEWLNDKLPHSIREIPITGGQQYSFLKYRESREVDEIGRKNRELMNASIREGKITIEQFDSSVAATPREFYEILFADLVASLKQCEKLGASVDEKFGANAPSFMGIKQAIEDCRSVVEPILKKKREIDPDPIESIVTTNGGPPQTSDSGAVEARFPDKAAGSPIQPIDRSDALRRLETIADFFHRTEPHSPVAYLVERAVRWGKMPFEQWLVDVINDKSVLARIRETLGIGNSEERGT